MDPVSTPPSKSLSSSIEPVVRVTSALCEYIVRERKGVSDAIYTYDTKMHYFIYALSIFQSIGRRLEIHGNHGLDNLLDFEHLGFGNSLHVGKLASRRMSHALDGVISSVIELLNIVGGNSMLLKTLECLIADRHL
jgi:hypothetical protein